MNICLFRQEEMGRPLPLRDERAVHLRKVLHKKEGDSFAAGIIGGEAGLATITAISEGAEGGIAFTFVPQGDGKPLYPLAMLIGFPRPIQLKRLLRDMAGLGVAEVHLSGTELGEKSYLQSELATSEAGCAMLLDGTVQAASTHVPRLVRHANLRESLTYIEENFSNADTVRIGFDNVRPEESLVSFLGGQEAHKVQNCVAAIGSERGWTDGERQLLASCGYSLLGLGKRVLRTETAATVAASLILGAMGAL